MSRHSDILSGSSVALFGLWVLWQANRFPGSSISTPGPGVFPAGIGLALTVLGSLLVATAVRRSKTPHLPSADGGRPSRQAALQDGRVTGVALYVGLVVSYSLALRQVPFNVVTPVFLLLLILVVDKRGSEISERPLNRLVAYLGVPAVVTAATYALFARLFRLPLP